MLAHAAGQSRYQTSFHPTVILSGTRVCTCRGRAPVLHFPPLATVPRLKGSSVEPSPWPGSRLRKSTTSVLGWATDSSSVSGREAARESQSQSQGICTTLSQPQSATTPCTGCPLKSPHKQFPTDKRGSTLQICYVNVLRDDVRFRDHAARLTRLSFALHVQIPGLPLARVSVVLISPIVAISDLCKQPISSRQSPDSNMAPSQGRKGQSPCPALCCFRFVAFLRCALGLHPASPNTTFISCCLERLTNL